MEHYIVREGWPFIGIAFAVFAVTIAMRNPALIFVGLALFIFVTWFFRNPERVTPQGEGIVVSPADGTVIDVSDKISIFMSVFNVHVNRIPVSGVVKKIDYNKGKFLVASKDKASLENEQNAVTIVDDKGREIKFVQIAGLVARRIVCHLNVGDKVVQGERFGMIRFGSRADVYPPAGFKPNVKLGDKVKAGETILGNY